MKKIYKKEYCFLQDLVPGHKAKFIVTWMEEYLKDFIAPKLGHYLCFILTFLIFAYGGIC